MGSLQLKEQLRTVADKAEGRSPSPRTKPHKSSRGEVPASFHCDISVWIEMAHTKSAHSNQMQAYMNHSYVLSTPSIKIKKKKKKKSYPCNRP
jgi:predicted DNA-binding protein (MmcQ/YjbR family)